MIPLKGCSAAHRRLVLAFIRLTQAPIQIVVRDDRIAFIEVRRSRRFSLHLATQRSSRRRLAARTFVNHGMPSQQM